jgi:hypothetical protein
MGDPYAPQSLKLYSLQWGSPLAANAAGSSATANAQTPLGYFVKTAQEHPGIFPDVQPVLDAYQTLAESRTQPITFAQARAIVTAQQTETPQQTETQGAPAPASSDVDEARATLESQGIDTSGMSDSRILALYDLAKKGVNVKVLSSAGDLATAGLTNVNSIGSTVIDFIRHQGVVIILGAIFLYLGVKAISES